MTITRFILTRHGETQWNVERRLQGHQDSPLTARGLRQASLLAERLQHEQIDLVYSSDLYRCHHTAQIVIQKTGLSVQLDERLRERNLGVLQGLKYDKIAEQYPDVAAAHRSGDPDYVVPEGESHRLALKRALACLEDLAATWPGNRILLVTHGSLLGVLLKHMLGIPLSTERKFQLKNGGINVISYTDRNWTVDTLGDVTHLTSLEAEDELLR